MYEDTRTGQLLPVLIGTTMLDKSGTDMEVPILGAERDKDGNIHPLGGTMEDPEGQGKTHWCNIDNLVPNHSQFV